MTSPVIVNVVAGEQDIIICVDGKAIGFVTIEEMPSFSSWKGNLVKSYDLTARGICEYDGDRGNPNQVVSFASSMSINVKDARIGSDLLAAIDETGIKWGN